MKNGRIPNKKFINRHIYNKSDEKIYMNNLTDVVVEVRPKNKNSTKINFFNKKAKAKAKLCQNIENKKFNTLTVQKYVTNSSNVSNSNQNKKYKSLNNIFNKKHYCNTCENSLSYNEKELNQKKFLYQITEMSNKFRNFNTLLEREAMRTNIKNKKDPSSNNIKTNLFNRLYGINEKTEKFKKQVMNKNKLKDIKNYQYDLMNYISGKVSGDNCADLVHELRKIRDDTELIKPLPQINFQNLISHSIDQPHSKLTRNTVIKDEYEKDLLSIKNRKIMAQKQNSKSYQETYRMLKILPEHIVNYLLKIRKIV